MKRLLAVACLCASALLRGAVSDVKIPQQSLASPPTWKDVIISPTANSLLGFDGNKTASGVTIGGGLQLLNGTLTATGSGSGTVTNNGTLTSGQPIIGDGTTVIKSGPINLAGGSSFVLNLLPVANGGTGTATPGLVQGSNVTITGVWPNQTINSTAGGSGTVTNFSAGTLVPIFTTSVATATSTPALTFILTNAAQNAVFAGPTSGTGAPSYRALTAPDIPTLTLSKISDAGGAAALNVGTTGGTVAAGDDSRIVGAVQTARTISTTAPLTGGGDLSANRTIAIPAATSSVNGYLTSADWTTFNGKQGAITFGAGVQTALGVNIGSAGAPVLFNGAGGTPSSMTGTNIAGTAAGLTAGAATILATGRTISITGDLAYTSPAFDGSGAVTAAGTISSGVVTDSKLANAVKPAVAVVATANLTLSGEQTIDGQLTSASLVLATGQSTGAQNGPWVTAAGAWARPAWYASGSTTQAQQFLTTFVRLGTLYQGSTWRMTTAAVTIDTTTTAWVQTPQVLSAASVANGVTGSGKAVLDTAPQISTIELGNASDTTLSRASAGVLAVEGVNVDTISATNTLTNKRVTPRVVTASDATSVTPNSDNADITYQINTQSTGTLTINADSGTPTNGQKWIFKIKATNVQTYAWNAVFVSGSDVTLPTVSTAAKVDNIGFIYDSVGSKWECVAVARGY